MRNSTLIQMVQMHQNLKLTIYVNLLQCMMPLIVVEEDNANFLFLTLSRD